jgi:hypothetical protein
VTVAAGASTGFAASAGFVAGGLAGSAAFMAGGLAGSAAVVVAAGFAGAAGFALAAGFAGAAGFGLAAGFAGAFGAALVAVFGSAAAFVVAAGFAGDFGFAAAAGFGAAGFFAAAGLLAALVFAVPDFGPPGAPGFGAPEDAVFARAVPVVPDAARPVFVPPARAGRGLAVLVAVLASGERAGAGGEAVSDDESPPPRNSLVTSSTADLPSPTAVSRMFFGVSAIRGRLPRTAVAYTATGTIGATTASPQAASTAWRAEIRRRPPPGSTTEANARLRTWSASKSISSPLSNIA